ncbi:MAG: type II toxin-antitoxin system HicA family toxin [Nitrospirae bacterium]|nr:type II toxin-antitoxin system HicA family toxin [Nitrospirota bacterium]MBF0536532.1 type II toxin-antitoxin system HicA family toxin [Nitrospirota bacterium]MBF0616619.1 type II toxin-antitoxin system HicA family toxin [Nitrospirota bacterium]
MKRKDLIRFIESNGCLLIREGANHTVYVNFAGNKTSVIPRHNEIDEFLARKICKDLGIPKP